MGIDGGLLLLVFVSLTVTVVVAIVWAIAVNNLIPPKRLG